MEISTVSEQAEKSTVKNSMKIAGIFVVVVVAVVCSGSVVCSTKRCLQIFVISVLFLR